MLLKLQTRAIKRKAALKRKKRTKTIKITDNNSTFKDSLNKNNITVNKAELNRAWKKHTKENNILKIKF
jgi:uncharacterized protein YvpB